MCSDRITITQRKDNQPVRKHLLALPKPALQKQSLSLSVVCTRQACSSAAPTLPALPGVRRLPRTRLRWYSAYGRMGLAVLRIQWPVRSLGRHGVPVRTRSCALQGRHVLPAATNYSAPAGWTARDYRG